MELYKKIHSEYNKFIAEMKKEPAEIIIESAYEIVSKENILMYCEEYDLKLSEKQFAALMSSKNTLDEVYREWCDNGEWHGIDDIGLALEETADRIQISRDRSGSFIYSLTLTARLLSCTKKNRYRGFIYCGEIFGRGK